MYDVNQLIDMGIVQFPSSILSQTSKEVDSFTSEVSELVEELFDVTRRAPGAGLSAIQLGISLRIFVIDCSRGKEESAPMAFINPTIRPIGEEKIVMEEGCLSIPNLYLPVERHRHVEVEFFDEKGTKKMEDFSELNAVVIQHEYDHLDGKVILDRVSRLRRESAKRKLKKIERANARN